MKFTPRLNDAIRTATVLHGSQMRKDGVPYITHPFAVAFIISEHTDDEDIIIAGLMHDTVEDVPGYTNEQLKEHFGSRVAHIVAGVTHEGWPGHTDLPEEEQATLFDEMLQRDLDKIDRAGKEAALVAAADKIHNLASLANGAKVHGGEFTAKFHRIPQKLAYYRNLLGVVRKYYPGSELADRFEKVLIDAERLLL